MCSIRGGDFGNHFSVYGLYVIPHCLMQEFFNSEHATADKSGLKV